jgi:predicted enzyme related to lactoylglutathione lyase
MTTASPLLGRFVWHDLMTPEPQAGMAFYTELLGIAAEATSLHGYEFHQWQVKGHVLGNVIPLDSGGTDAHWLSYIAVEDLEACVARVRELEGSVAIPPREVAGVGQIAVVQDLHGARFGLFAGDRGPMACAEGEIPQGSVCWDELKVPDAAMASRFYDALFDWGQQGRDMGDWIYHVQTQGERQVAGIMSPRHPMPAHWCPYFFVNDIDAVHARALEMGAKSLVQPMNIPNVGRISNLIDTQGASFALFGAEKL